VLRPAILAAAIGVMATLAACDDASQPPRDYKTVEISPFLGEPVMGDPAAPVEIVEYASTTCGHCLAFHRDEFPQLKKAYIDTGKARLRWVVLPTPPPEVSVAGAAIASCAGEKKFFDVIADLFSSQDSLVEATRSPRRLQDRLVALGERHGLSFDQVNTCVDSDAIRSAIVAGMRNAPSTITGTPTFFVDGEKVEEHTFAALSAAIDARLAARGPPSPPI
jgi:protein-disulfide isomerase